MLCTAGRHCAVLNTKNTSAQHLKLETAKPAERTRMGNIEELDLAHPHHDVGEQTARQLVEALL